MTGESPLVLVLAGPTAVGKTDIALALADLVPISIISMDSAMVYRGMDIGTAKPSVQVLDRYPHALVDIRDPADAYSAADFLKDADRAVSGALAADRLPVLVGGSMLYLRSFRHGLAAMPGADPAVRGLIEKRGRTEGWDALYTELQHVDPVAARGIHPHNTTRIQRALEVFEITGKPISSFWGSRETTAETRLGVQLLEFSVMPDDRRALHQRIDTRLGQMFDRGFLQEVEALKAREDLNPDLPSMRAVGYQQVWQFLDGRVDEAGMRARVLAATRQLAKRQLTWLRGWPEMHGLHWGRPQVLAGKVLEKARLAIS